VKVRSFDLKDGMHVHLVGVGGSGLSAIAHVLLDRDFPVSGSDMESNERTRALAARGARVAQGHAAGNINGAELLVISSAIPSGNPEIEAARAAGIPVMKRADFLRYLMAGQVAIAVAGTHGKTTTTAMIAQILIENGYDPSLIIGGSMELVGRNGRAGKGDYFIVEADEYDHMFLGLRPEIAVITNIEHDHPDIFPTRGLYLHAFWEFANLLPAQGTLVLCGEEAGNAELLDELDGKVPEVVTYGLAGGQRDFDLMASDLRPNQLGGSDFVLLDSQGSVGLVRLRVPGQHNVQNALAAIAVARELEINFGQICRALAEFGGVGRRFQVLGEAGGVTVIDDYAHHPTEIQATLAAARQRFGDRRIWAVWQPHTFSRTRLLMPEFAASFSDADRVVVLDIYRSRETDALGLESAGIATGFSHPAAVYAGSNEEAAAYLLDRIRPNDVVITLGAGDGNLVAVAVLDALQERVNDYRP